MVARTKDRDDVDYCIATEPIESLKSSYGFRQSSKLRARIGNAEIWEHYKEIYEVEGERLSFKRKFRLFPNVESGFNPSRSLNCKDDELVQFYGGILKPSFK